MSNFCPFVIEVINHLNNDTFYRDYKKSTFYYDYYIMDKDADKIRPPGQEGWTIYATDCVIFTNISIERGWNKVPLTWKEKRALLKAFRGAVTRLKKDREAFLKSLRN